MLARRLKVVRLMIGTALFAGLAIPPTFMAQEDEGHESPRFPHYRVIDLGTLGGAFSAAYGINAAGSATGCSTLTPRGVGLHAVLWYRDGHLRDLGTLGGPNSCADGPNARDEAVIISETANKDPNGEDFCQDGTHLQCLAAIWKNAELTALPTLAGGNNAQAYWLSNRGQVVGFSENDVKEKKGYCATPFQIRRFEAVTWEPDGEIQELRPLNGDTVGFAWGINDRGQAVGVSGLCSNTVLPPNPAAPHAVLWERDGAAVDLGSLGGTYNVATSVNNRGEVVGGAVSSKDGTVHAFLWTRETGMQDLGRFPGAVVTVAPCCNTINDRGEMAGFAVDANGNSRALVWLDKKMYDLNTLIPKDSPWHLQGGESINNAGEIAGYGLIQGETHAFLAVPCDRHDDHGECCKDEAWKDAEEPSAEAPSPDAAVNANNVRQQLPARPYRVAGPH